MPKLDFVKMQGCGNDYIYVIADRVRPANPSALARRFSERRFGIGGDGLILLCPSRSADVRMEMYNADGSRGEMCGNGIRCVARLQYGIEGGQRNPIVVDTDCGMKTISLIVEDLRPIAATVDMGEPILEGREIPVRANGRVISYPLEIGVRDYKITAISMGNPHCVVFAEDESVFDLDDVAFAQLGLRFENNPFFPKRVNTEFILPVGRDHLKMRVWERGSGETLACGTGACAALVAAVLNGHSERQATVELRGGKLDIEWRERGDGANHVFMTGDAVEIYRGSITVGDDELIDV